MPPLGLFPFVTSLVKHKPHTVKPTRACSTRTVSEHPHLASGTPHTLRIASHPPISPAFSRHSSTSFSLPVLDTFTQMESCPVSFTLHNFFLRFIRIVVCACFRTPFLFIAKQYSLTMEHFVHPFINQQKLVWFFKFC